jgi:AAA+ ATPase superfamily predicted ATPase
VYFSILEAIAGGYNKRSEIADYTKMNYDSLGFYLENLENVYHYIEKLTPVIEQKTTLNRYRIQDNFLIFWFRYIYKNGNLIEIKKYETLRKIIMADLPCLEGFAFEKLVKDLIITRNITNSYVIEFDRIGNYWDKGGNEIDLICINHCTKEAVFIECKLQESKITPQVRQELVRKSETIAALGEYKKQYRYYGLESIGELL